MDWWVQNFSLQPFLPSRTSVIHSYLPTGHFHLDVCLAIISSSFWDEFNAAYSISGTFILQKLKKKKKKTSKFTKIPSWSSSQYPLLWIPSSSALDWLVEADLYRSHSHDPSEPILLEPNFHPITSLLKRWILKENTWDGCFILILWVCFTGL